MAGTLTWLGNNGFYVDAQAQLTLFDSTLRSLTANRDLVNGNDAQGYALGVESGWRLPLNASWSLIPQVQLMYSAVQFNDFRDTFGTQVALNDGESLIGRGGVAAEYRTSWRDPARGLVSAGVYGIANLYYEFLDGSATNVANIAFASAQDRTWAGSASAATIAGATANTRCSPRRSPPPASTTSPTATPTEALAASE